MRCKCRWKRISTCVSSFLSRCGRGRSSFPNRGIRPLSWPAHAAHRRNVAMLLAADVVLKPYVVAQIVDEARLPIARVVPGVVNGNDDLELRPADLADALDRAHLVGVRRAGSVDESLVVEPGRLDHQGIALEMAHGIAVVGGKSAELLL